MEVQEAPVGLEAQADRGRPRPPIKKEMGAMEGREGVEEMEDVVEAVEEVPQFSSMAFLSPQ